MIPGVTNVNRWEITASTTHTLPVGYELIDAWARGSGSNTIGVTSGTTAICGTSLVDNYLPAEQDADLNSFSATAATMTGYIYELLDNSFTTVGWWPYDTTGQARFAYTLYMSDPTAIGIDEESELAFNMFPNPSNNTVTIQLGTEIKGKTDIILTDLTGKLVKVIATGQNMASGQIVNFTVNELAQGMYFVSLRNNEKQLTRKLLVNK